MIPEVCALSQFPNPSHTGHREELQFSQVPQIMCSVILSLDCTVIRNLNKMGRRKKESKKGKEDAGEHGS